MDSCAGIVKKHSRQEQPVVKRINSTLAFIEFRNRIVLLQLSRVLMRPHWRAVHRFGPLPQKRYSRIGSNPKEYHQPRFWGERVVLLREVRLAAPLWRLEK